MSELSLTIARPYAQAVFDFSIENQTLMKWELMLTYIKNLFQNKIILELITHFGYIDLEKLSDILILICEHNLDCFGQNFVRIIVQNQRMYLIGVILDEFIRLRRIQEMVVKVKVVSVFPLQNFQLSKIENFVKRQFFCTVHMICHCDPSILGGIIMYIGNLTIDASVRGRIKRLKRTLFV